ncbi:cupin domain-containing protein [Bacteroides sp. OttesenSCG-928-J23]|nr:cupin domain-containing protein [Bacteroides sp. OttesenSCG-928-J23]MDL2299900.1 cupin domain-containing protein [Bacteroides sp. OttesenSCG-928-E20]MDL2304900.1 cupin domain-containing protein [Bacteroides sp. OttesenSCG-928-D19]
MSTIKYSEAPITQVSSTIERRFIRTSNLMTVIVDFSGGPATAPDPFHSHPHEQTCYIAEGEILFFLSDDPPVHLKAGDMFAVASGISHSVQLLTPTARLVDSFNPIREDFLNIK